MIKVGINIGNSKISCIVSDYSISKKTRVLSLISHPTEEVKKNLILNYQKLLDEIDRLAPYGHQFPSPQFQIQAKATLQSFGKSSEHLKIRFIDGVTGIKWRSSIDDLEYDASKGSVGVSVVCQIEYDSYIKSPRLLVHEITLLE